MNQLENCQARYRSNTWMGRTRTDGPDEFEPTKFDCNNLMENNHSLKRTLQLYYLVLLMGGNQYNVPIMKILFAKGAQFWG